MSYYLTEEQELIRDSAREFAETELKPNAKKLDETHEFPWEWVKRAGELGFFGLAVSEEYGGVGADTVSEALVMEEIAKYSASLGIIIDAHTSICCTLLEMVGTPEQKSKYLLPAAKGENLMSFAMTEPSAGSDAGGSKTTAVLDGGEWVINGSKAWISNIAAAKTYVITAKTDLEAKGSKGISSFIVEADTPGLVIGSPEHKMGLNNSYTGEIFFKNMRIPKDNLLGQLNRGFPLFLKGLDKGRIALSSVAIGTAEGAYERALAYSKERQQFGRPISSFQAIAFKLAEMATSIELARTLLYRVARMCDDKMLFTKEAAMLKFYSTEMAKEVCSKALEIHGGNGYSRDCEVERYVRDAQGLTLTEGTAEINRLVVSNHILA